MPRYLQKISLRMLGRETASCWCWCWWWVFASMFTLLSTMNLLGGKKINLAFHAQRTPFDSCIGKELVSNFKPFFGGSTPNLLRKISSKLDSHKSYPTPQQSPDISGPIVEVSRLLRYPSAWPCHSMTRKYIWTQDLNWFDYTYDSILLFKHIQTCSYIFSLFRVMLEDVCCFWPETPDPFKHDHLTTPAFFCVVQSGIHGHDLMGLDSETLVREYQGHAGPCRNQKWGIATWRRSPEKGCKRGHGNRGDISRPGKKLYLRCFLNWILNMNTLILVYTWKYRDVYRIYKFINVEIICHWLTLWCRSILSCQTSRSSIGWSDSQWTSRQSGRTSLQVLCFY